MGRPRKACRFRCGWCLPPPKIFTALFSPPSCAEFRSRLACPIFNTVAAREKEALTLQFFWQEARTLAARLQLTPRLLQVLTQYVYRGNVGELKNVVKYAVASARAGLRAAKC